MQSPNLFSFNNTMLSPDVAGAVPLVIEFLQDVEMGAMTSGKVSKNVASVFANGTPLFVIPAKTRDTIDNAVLSYSVGAGTIEGTIAITQHSSSSTSTSNITNSFLVIGTLEPNDTTVE